MTETLLNKFEHFINSNFTPFQALSLINASVMTRVSKAEEDDAEYRKLRDEILEFVPNFLDKYEEETYEERMKTWEEDDVFVIKLFYEILGDKEERLALNKAKKALNKEIEFEARSLKNEILKLILKYDFVCLSKEYLINHRGKLIAIGMDLEFSIEDINEETDNMLYELILTMLFINSSALIINGFNYDVQTNYQIMFIDNAWTPIPISEIEKAIDPEDQEFIDSGNLKFAEIRKFKGNRS